MRYLARFFKPFITRWPSRWIQLAAMLVVAQSCGQSDSSSLLGPTVSPLDSAIVQLTPQQVTLASGDSNQFVAVEIVPDSGEVVADVVWTATGGTITSTGLFTAGATPGAYQVTAQVRGHSRYGTAPVVVATPLLTSLSLSPATVNLVEGGTQQFAVAGSWSNGSMSAPPVTYSATGGTTAPGGLYTAGSTPGAFRVIATQQGGTKADTSIVSITAPAAVLIQMVLAPAAVTLAPGGIGQFSVTGTWSDGSATAPAVSFAANGGTITAGGVYTAGTMPGTYRVVAAQQGGSKADTSAVTISAAAPTLTKLTISPKNVSIAVNGAQQFAVSGAWSDGSVTVPAATYSATGGTITVNGSYTAGAAAGTFAVIATQQGGAKADTAVVTITTAVAPPALTKLTISPKTVSLAANGAQQFAVSGAWSDGSVTVPIATYSATGGTITASGAYTAGATAGTFAVIATQQRGTKADTASVTVTAAPPTLTKLTISPKAVSLAPSGVQVFSVSGSWSDGSVTVPVATYSATGGTITAGGSYTAGTTTGTFRVIAVQSGGTKADTAAVTVVALPATSLAMVTQPAGAVSGVVFTQQPVVELRNAQNQPVLQSGVVVTASIPSGTGTLGGTLTATTTAQGRAVFSSLQIAGTGSYTLNFAASGLAAAESQTITVALPSLRVLASARNLRMGTDVVSSALTAGGTYVTTLASQYNSVTPDNAMKFSVIHPGPTQYSFTAADQLVNFAQANGMVVHGHTLVWGQAIPTWVTAGTFTKAQLLAILQSHIATVVGRYAGKVATWDVVNEALAWNGTLLSNIWLNTIGPEYIDSAFVWAHRADPTAKLYYNDYSAEGPGQKADGLLALVQQLQARGVPIDGVGFETHAYPSTTLPTGLPAESAVSANFARFANAGVDIRVSEMDVMIPDTAGTSALTTQAGVFQAILDACILQPRCTEFTTWGFTDLYSWIPASFPGFGRGLPFDLNYQPKPAFDSLAVRLGRP